MCAPYRRTMLMCSRFRRRRNPVRLPSNMTMASFDNNPSQKYTWKRMHSPETNAYTVLILLKFRGSSQADNGSI
ncbi:hypothetical protein PSAC2689_30257 [Paraburkholderia sacchari]